MQWLSSLGSRRIACITRTHACPNGLWSALPESEKRMASFDAKSAKPSVGRSSSTLRRQGFSAINPLPQGYPVRGRLYQRLASLAPTTWRAPMSTCQSFDGGLTSETSFGVVATWGACEKHASWTWDCLLMAISQRRSSIFTLPWHGPPHRFYHGHGHADSQARWHAVVLLKKTSNLSHTSLPDRHLRTFCLLHSPKLSHSIPV